MVRVKLHCKFLYYKHHALIVLEPDVEPNQVRQIVLEISPQNMHPKSLER